MTLKDPAELTIIVVSYNTKALTLKCLETLMANTKSAVFHTVVIDNASSDGSAKAIRARFPQVELIDSDENLGFAKANNLIAKAVTTKWTLLLNPDTEVYDGAIDRIVAFAETHPENGIYGGRTVFPDGSLNIASCWNRITPWSAFCSAVGLSAAFPKSPAFNTEAIAGWNRDTVREVDIVVGCFFLIRSTLWHELGGFNEKYFMYGEESDLCLRAIKRGAKPIIVPDAEIMHLVGASSARRVDKTIMVARARATLIRDHWPTTGAQFGLAMLWLWAASRYSFETVHHALLGSRAAPEPSSPPKWRQVWNQRSQWLSGY
ncbi:MAG: glycosyltransferase [Marinosulfonomonas sp.]